VSACFCPRCRPREISSLHEIAPRLARARDGLVTDRRSARRRRRLLRDSVLHREWLVAHRDLQLARASATGNGRYILRRRRLLDAARAGLARFQGLLDEAERVS
jgi:hypothetical protein